ncbi:MAG: SDR family oxidoreductase, partial [Pseudomonadota bacterium]
RWRSPGEILSMPGDLDQKVAIITGGASGIGRATALAMVEAGAKVVIADINEEGARRTATQIGEAAMAFQMDVSAEDDWTAVTEETIRHFGRLDIVGNIAGIGRGGTIEDVTLDDWNAMIAVNLTGVMLGCKHGIKAIHKSGGAGAIINMSSIGGLIGVSDIAAYCGSKGGVTTLTKSVALHCAEQGYPIRCMSVHPTYVDSEMLDPVAEMAGVSRAELVSGMAPLVPMKRVATPQDVANTIVFLASDKAAMISGSAIAVDGAQLAGPPPAHFS